MRLSLFSLLFLLLTGSLAAQTDLSGKVTFKSDNEPAIGVSIKIKGTDKGTVTDFDGNYTLPAVAQNAILEFAFGRIAHSEMQSSFG